MKDKILSNNLLALLLNLLLAFFILLAGYLNYGIADSHCYSAVLTTALYFCLVASPLTICRFGNSYLLSMLSVALISVLAVSLPGAWVWAVVALLLCVYDLWIVRSTWMLTLLNFLFTAVVAAVSYGFFKVLFWLVTLLKN